MGRLNFHEEPCDASAPGRVYVSPQHDGFPQVQLGSNPPTFLSCRRQERPGPRHGLLFAHHDVGTLCAFPIVLRDYDTHILRLDREVRFTVRCAHIFRSCFITTLPCAIHLLRFDFPIVHAAARSWTIRNSRISSQASETFFYWFSQICRVSRLHPGSSSHPQQCYHFQSFEVPAHECSPYLRTTECSCTLIMRDKTNQNETGHLHHRRS